MQHPISGHLVVCSYHLYKLLFYYDHFDRPPLVIFSHDLIFIFFMFAAIAELLDNAVDEVIIPDV